ncbi:MAG: IS256 family transposase, partial [Proteobacteria bacterium]|nr:IS256 family transposase [Pseudomonadota bacterium]
MAEPERLFEMMEFDTRVIAERTLFQMLKVELTRHLGREKYMRAMERQINRRNGSYS